MAVYTYQASNGASDRIIDGTIAADTPRQARDELRDRGLVVRDLSEVRAATGAITSRKRRPRVRRSQRAQLTTFFQELSTLLEVGVPLFEALDTLAAQQRRSFQSVILLLRDRVASGASLAAAMREQPGVFDELSINMTEVGEDAGTLDASLARLAGFLERSDQLRDRVGTALIYPAIVTTVAVAAAVFLMTFVVPRILEPLIQQGLPLPWPTRVVKGVSDFALTWWPLILGTVAAIVAITAALLRTDRGRRRWHHLLLRLPLIGEMVRKQELVRVAVVLSTLLRSGIVLVRALQIGQRSTRNLILRDALRDCESAVSAGGDVTESLRRSGVFPPVAVQVFALGQESGRLEEMLDRLAVTYERQLAAAAQRLAAVLEPAIIVLLALGVLFLVMATILPILEAGNAIQ
jgi:type II secretory pathway component PulF